MKKIILIFLALLLIAATVFAACSKSNDEETTSSTTTAAAADNGGIEGADTEFGYETETVTDKNGEAVTDKNGKKVTTEVAVVYKTNKKGKKYAQKIDSDGKGVTNKKGKPVTVATTAPKSTTTTTTTSGKSDKTTTTKASETTTEKPTATTNKNAETTNEEDTTDDSGSVPKTSAKGTEVNFSVEDQEIIANMLEVPYLYKENYENSDGVPIETAVYTAVWMAQHEGGTADSYPSSPVCLNLFKYYGQTVVNFKTKCNDVSDTPIKYNKNSDTFSVSTYPEKKQSVKITKIEDVGNGYYKVTGSVDGAGLCNKVVAIMQKNKLDTSLGFSVKALKWS